MFSRRLKTGYFALEGLNSFATVYFFYYLYFFMQKAYGFGNQANLMLAALNGATYALMAWFAGRFAQRCGYFTALKVGYVIMIGALSFGMVAHTATGEVLVMVVIVVGMSFTWPTLEALVSEGEPRTGLQHMVGVYNVIWAATAALANFTGGAMLEKLGLASLFYVPMVVHIGQLSLTLGLERQAGRSPPTAASQNGQEQSASSNNGRNVGSANVPPGLPRVRGSMARDAGWQVDGLAKGAVQHGMACAGVLPERLPARATPIPGAGLEAAQGAVLNERAALATGRPWEEVCPQGLEHPVTLPKAKRFLRMAWVANPFAYIAINTLIAVVPGITRRLELSTMAAGFCCSTWCFARLGAFAALWRWTGWHYKFRWLLLAYLGLVSSFGTVLLAPNVVVLVLAQVVFGASVGLLYYSSLFYSMDRSETKGEHGGIHEAVIGLGNCAGPAVGAAALQIAPQFSQSGTIAVIALLLCGLGGLVGIWSRKSVGEPKKEGVKNEHTISKIEAGRE